MVSLETSRNLIYKFLMSVFHIEVFVSGLEVARSPGVEIDHPKAAVTFSHADTPLGGVFIDVGGPSETGGMAKQLW